MFQYSKPSRLPKSCCDSCEHSIDQTNKMWLQTIIWSKNIDKIYCWPQEQPFHSFVCINGHQQSFFTFLFVIFAILKFYLFFLPVLFSFLFLLCINNTLTQGEWSGGQISWDKNYFFRRLNDLAIMRSNYFVTFLEVEIPNNDSIS